MQNIAILVRFAHFLSYIQPVLDLWDKDPQIRLVFISNNCQVKEILEHRYENPCLVSDLDLSVYRAYDVQAIFCFHELWLPELLPVFYQARKDQVPVISFDHGSFLGRSAYELEREELFARHLSFTAPAIHLWSWGQLGKDALLSYAVPEEKISVLGLPAFDALEEVESGAFSEILLCTSMHTGIEEIDRTQRVMIDALCAWLEQNRNVRLTVKAHPLEMQKPREQRYAYPSETRFVANLYEQAWEDCQRKTVSQMFNGYDLVLSIATSLLAVPLQRNIPVGLISVPLGAYEHFAQRAENAMHLCETTEELNTLLEDLFVHDSLKPCHQSLTLAQKINQGFKDPASDMLVQHMDCVLERKRHKDVFYRLSIEQELLETLERFEHLPYPYQNLLRYYVQKQEYLKADRMRMIYEKKFVAFDDFQKQDLSACLKEPLCTI